MCRKKPSPFLLFLLSGKYVVLDHTFKGAETPDSLYLCVRGLKRYEFSNHLGNVMVTLSDRRVWESNSSRWTADAISGQDYDPFGMVRPNRSVSEDGYRFGFNRKEKDSEFSNEAYDFGARIYDGRVARWLSVDPMAGKYPNISPFAFVNNMPIWAIDPDGEDIIILNAPKGANGAGHAAVLIGNDKTGWYYYSKDGTTGAGGYEGENDVNIGRNRGGYFITLNEFANSEENYDVSHAEQRYTGAYRIKATPEKDALMQAEAFKVTVNKKYHLIKCSCIDVASDALSKGGFDPGYHTILGKEVYLNDLPNMRYKAIKRNNPGTDISNQIKMSSEKEAFYDKKHTPSRENLNEIEKKLNSLENKLLNNQKKLEKVKER